MIDFTTAEFWLAALEIIAVNILLSGDNAVVIALACRKLPRRQRTLGVIWGALGAIVLRIAITFFAVRMLELPFLKLVGGALLLWIGIKLIVDDAGTATETSIRASDRLVAAVWTIIVADLVMSLDNVVAVAAAARGSLWLLVFGLVVSIPLVIVGAQLFMRITDRYPLVVIAGGALLGFIAGQLMVDDRVLDGWVGANAPWLEWTSPIAGILLVIAGAKWLPRRTRRAR